MEDFSFLFELEQQLHSSEVRSNVSKLSIILSPNFTEFGSSGKIWTLHDMLKRLPYEESTKDPQIKIESYNYLAKKLSSDVVLVTYISKTKNLEYLRSSIWRKNPSGWQLEFHQGTFKI